jgi:autotransporter-associated beta strand protein
MELGVNAGATAAANLNAGTVTTPSVTLGTGTGALNFNGGTLKASVANSSFVNGLTRIMVFNNGANIDDGGFSVTVPQALQAPVGFGVATIPLTAGGSGYIDSPIVTISGGNGSNATATATVSGGAVTAVTVTCPGMGYNNSDALTVSFSGGGASVTPPTVGAITFVQNGSGGFTKKGTGTLTLTGANTFKGALVNSAGTLSLRSATTYGAVNVNAGTVLMTTAPTITNTTTVANNAIFTVSQIGSASASISNLTLNGAAAVPGATLGLAVSPANNPLVPLVNAGTVTLTGTNTIALAGAFNVGKLALVKYVGALAGTGNCTNLALPQGATGSISNDVADSILWANITSTSPGLVWTGTNVVSFWTNLWDIGVTNWLLGATPAPYTQTIAPGDAVTFNDIGTGTPIVNGPLSPSSMLISNNSTPYTFTGPGLISGPTTVQKLGSGTAILKVTNNTYIGDTTISNGTLQAGLVNAISPAGNLVLGPGGTFEVAGLNQTANELTGTGVVDNNTGTDQILTIGGSSGGTWNGTIQDHGGGGIALAKNGAGTWIVGGSNYLNNGAGFTVRQEFNAGTTILTNGGLIVDSILELRIADGAGLNSTMIVDGGTLITSNLLSVGDTAVTANGTLVVNHGTVIHGGPASNPFGLANDIIVGAGGATGTLIVNGGQVLNSQSLTLGQNAGANGTLYLNGGLVQADVMQSSGTPASSTAYFNGGTLQATTNSSGFLVGVTANVMGNGLVLDDGGFAVTLGEQLVAGDANNGGLIKKGSGQVYLDAINTYTGPTLVTNGTLAGIGTISGPVVVGPAGNLGAGNASVTVGQLTLNSTLTLQGNATMRVDKTGGTTSQDQIVVGGNTTYGGILTVTNATSDGTPLTTTNSFQLFSVTGTPSGNFTGISGSPGAGLAYSFNPANGVLSVVIGVASNPTNINFSVSGGTLSLSWPTDHLGWILQTQTNSLNVGLSTNWVDVAGSANVIQTNITLRGQTPAAFFRLRKP